MNKITCVILMSMAAATAGCAPRETTNLPPPGHYERTSSTTNADGTAVERQHTTDVMVDSNGNRVASMETTTTTDPPGLFNARTSTTTRTVQEK